MQTILTTQRYEDEDLIYTKIVSDRGLIFEKGAKWFTENKSNLNKFLKKKEITIIRHSISSLGGNYVAFTHEDFPDNVGHIIMTRRGAISVKACSKDMAQSIKIVNTVKEAIPTAAGPEKGDIQVSFWHSSSAGPRSNVRKIAAPTWKEIRNNYSGSTQEGLDKLMSFVPNGGGQLILMHGHPGSGKTYSIRALCQAWKSWCKSQYILDPEQLFGGSAYFSSLILDGEPSPYDDEDDTEYEDTEAGITVASPWRLLILEDTGELLTEDARSRAGQGLSRLLNLVDGFIGQGLRVLVLITTNEELEKLHPAVSRDGRCAATIEFTDFSYEEAKKWAKDNDIVLPEVKTYSLAQLFAIKKGNAAIRVEHEDVKAPLGFRMAG